MTPGSTRSTLAHAILVLGLMTCLTAGCDGDGDPAVDASGLDAGGDAASADAARTDGSDVDAGACAVTDNDGDGHDAIACGGDDCDDDDARRFPGNIEVCDDADLDEDCDPSTYGDREADGDGYASDACCNAQPGGTPLCGPDCDDTRRGVHPDAPEVCNEVDDDCDGLIDEGVVLTCYEDRDGDGYAPVGARSAQYCDCPPRTTSRPPEDAADCDDDRPAVSPSTPEICDNGLDDNCNGVVDEAGSDWYRDCDGDGFGTGAPTRSCISPGVPAGCPFGGHVLVPGDCADDDRFTFPGAPEVCDGRVNDCDGTGPADGPVASAWCNGGEGAPAPVPNAQMICAGGTCVFDACVSGYGDCTAAAGCETNLSMDGDHCGACSRRCVTTGLLGCHGGICGWHQVAADGHTTCVRSSIGDAYCFGLTTGDGTVWSGDHAFPRRLLLDEVTDLSPGTYHGCAARADGTAHCWGVNDAGQLGVATPEEGYLAPQPVPGLTNIVSVAVSDGHSCAMTSGGRAYCWGTGFRGQLGDGRMMDTHMPSAVVGLTDAREIVAGALHTCARRATGGVVCWGWNDQGQVGSGTTYGDTRLPVAVVDLDDAVAIGAGRSHTCALRATGGVVCWGANDRGQLGDGTTTGRTRPTPVSGVTASVLAVGDHHACVVRATSNTVLCWGDNTRGQLATDPSVLPMQSTPRLVGSLTAAADVATGGAHSCARLLNGEVRCWGSQGLGELGTGVLEPLSRFEPALILTP